MTTEDPYSEFLVNKVQAPGASNIRSWGDLEKTFAYANRQREIDQMESRKARK